MAAVVGRALFVRIVVTSAFLLSLGSFVRADAVPAGRLCPLAVEDGRCSCVVPTDQPGAKYFLIVSALASARLHGTGWAALAWPVRSSARTSGASAWMPSRGFSGGDKAVMELPDSRRWAPGS